MEKEIDTIKLEFDVIMGELKSGKKKTGRPHKLTLETYKTFLYFYLHTSGDNVYAYYKSGMGKNIFDRMKAGSETFRAVLEVNKTDTLNVSKMVLSKDVRGSSAVKDKNGNIIIPAIAGNVDTAKFIVNKEVAVKAKETAVGPMLGAPRNEVELELQKKLLAWYKEYETNRTTTESDS